MADRSRSKKHERVLHNWRRLVMSAMSQPSSRPGRIGSDFPDSVPASLGQASNINTILQVANEIQSEAPNVSRILCEYAYSLSQSLDPTSEGRGVLQFKTGLMSVIKQKLAKKDGAFDRRQDIATVGKFYNDYREKHRFDDLQVEGRVDSFGLQDAQHRSRGYTVLRVLKDCVYALARDSSVDPDTIIPAKLKNDMESDAKKSEAFQPYNILPLEAHGVSDAILSFPEVTAARLALQVPGLRLSNHIKMPKRNWDILDALMLAFGFQHDNVRNQREHLVLLLANSQSQLGGMSGPSEQVLHTDVINTLFRRLLGNYEKWCRYIRKEPVHARRDSSEEKVAFMSLYLLIWGEAANVRFLPEGLCYIFHNMAKEFAVMLDSKSIEQSVSCKGDNGQSFLDQIITPLYLALKEEASNGGKSGHSKWRNYDDFNEFFWSHSCFKELGWPMNHTSSFFGNSMNGEGSRRRHLGKTSFVEHRTFFHLYHSFVRTWILLVLMLQGLAIIAFTKGFNLERLKILLSLGLTYFVMKVIESTLDIILMVGAYTSSRCNAVSRIFARFIFFGGCTGGLFFLYLKMMFEGNNNNTYLKIYLLSLGIYVALQLILSVFLHIPALRKQSEKSDRIVCFEPIKWLYQERYFVGRGLFENPRDYLRYVLFWIFVLGCKFTFSYFLQIEPLVAATKEIVSANDDITYRWHDFFSKHKHNAFAVLFLWAPVILIYLLDISVWYTVFSAIWGGLLGARDHLGEIRSNEMLRNRFESFPEAFVNNLDHGQLDQSRIENEKDRVQNSAQRFAPIWNDIINCLREQDYITNREKDLLMMPSNTALPLVQWPLFLLVSKVFLAMDLAMDKKESSEEVWEKLGKDQYMTSAVREAFESVHMLLTDLVQGEGGKWFQRVFDDVNRSVIDKSFFAYFQINNVQDVVKKITALTGLLKTNKEEGVASAVQGLHESVYNFLSERSRDSYPKLSPSDVRIKFGSIRSLEEDKREAVKRLHSLLTIKESAATVPKNLEARRRLEYFTNSLFMKMPAAPTVAAMKSFCVYTPYYDEIVMYSKEELREDNEDGISTLFYLQKIYPDEWKNFLERIGLIESIFDNKLKSGSLEPENLLKLRLWASYRGQTLARTVRGMMYYRRALILQSFLEAGGKEGQSQSGSSGNSRLAKAYADLKFTYVITCQRFGAQKTKKEAKAADILYLMEENEALRIAYIDEVESETGKGEKYYYSKLVKNDGATRGLKDQEIYSIKLPGYPILGEGKPENQNHAVIFTRGDALQTIDMNQDNYFEEALKMRNLLQEFSEDHGLRAPTILGVREHVFTGSVSSLAWFMSNQETSFVTLGQRVLARPLKIRMHYGHPDVFDRLFHLTRGGFSKASKVINISEDIYAGFNSTLRQGNITHHEYIQVGKGRDVGLNQIAMFEAKVASGNGEQSLSRDVYRLGQLLDFFRMLSFFVTSVGFYVCTMMTVLVVYVFLYGKAYLALSGVGQSLENLAIANNNKALQSALDTQFLFQIGVFTAIPMLMGFILEKGVLKAIVSFITMQLQLCSVFFTFSLGTRTHYFGRTILHGGAKYRSTGRGFVVTHVKFAENYRLYSRSHFVKALEIAMLLIVYLAYGFEESSTSYILLSFSSWFLVLSWLFAPYIFNPSGFEWQKTVDDIDDWMGWLLYRGGVGVKAEESWEAWWEEEQAHIRHNRGRILETILSLRFFFFQYGVVYQLKAANKDTSLAVYGVSWLVLAGVVVLFKAFSLNPKTSLRFRTFLRLSQGVLVILLVGGLVTVVALTRLTAGDVFASLLALIPTGWGILSIGIAWKGRIKMFGLWSSFRAIARFYDAAMGTIIFLPVVFLSWFPFVSTFQTRLLFNQAFSRGLEISLILAGNRPNAQA